MTQKLPTVDELVQVFIDNHWKGRKGSEGATRYGIENCTVCAIPALIKFSGEEFNYRDLYSQVDEIYGEQAANSAYDGFDFHYYNNEISKLTSELRNRLEELGMMA